MNGFQQKILNRAKEKLDALDDWQKEFIKYLANLPPGKELSTNENHKLNEVNDQLTRFNPTRWL